MGRPIKKKFFGNRNVGTGSASTDSGIGGEGLAAYTLAAQKGSLIINATYSQPQLVIPAPSLPTGVQATASVVWEVESITVQNGLAGHGYTTTTGGATTLTGLGGGVTANITAVGSGQGEVQTIVPVNRGDFTTVPTAAVTYQIVGGDGNQQATVKFRVKSITTVEKGSGYITAPTISWTTAGTNTGGTAVGAPTVALTTDSGDVGTTTNQENAIIAYAKTTSGGTRKIADIISQKGSTRFRVRTADGTSTCTLRTDGGSGVDTMDITAYDSDNGEYWVYRLSAKNCVLIRKGGGSGGTQFTNGTKVPWNLDAAVPDVSVKLQNA